MFCKKCGEQIPEDSEFCPVCGEKQEMTLEEEKDEKGGAGKIVRKAVKGVVMIVGPLATTFGQTLLNGVGKAVSKKTGKVTNNLLKKAGLKKKTPLDSARKVWKKMRK